MSAFLCSLVNIEALVGYAEGEALSEVASASKERISTP